MNAKQPAKKKTGPLPPPPAGPGQFVYAQDPLTFEPTGEPVAVRGAVSVPLNRLAEYLKTYGLRQVPGTEVKPIGGDYVMVIEKVEA